MRAQTGAGTFLAVVAVAWSVVRCGAPGATQAVAAGDDSGGTTTGPGGSGPDSGGGQSTPDAGAAEADSGASPGSGDADASQCPVACTGTTPVCDQGTCVTCTDTAGCSGNTPVCNTDADGGVGQCVQVQILAFELTDAQMVDRAHAAYQRHANAWFPQTGMDEGFFTFTVTNDWDQLATIQPQKGLIVMFVNISPADVALSGPNQSAIQAGFQSYMENGGAWFGSHYSGYNDNSGSWNWPWYFDTFIGTGFYVMNTWEPVSINVDVDDPTHPVSQGLGSMFTTAPSEWYSWTNDLRTMPNIDILLSVNPSSFPVGTDPTQSWTSGYYPIAWTNTNYKMMYLNAGHELMDYTTDTGLSDAFTSHTQNLMYVNAFKWLGGAQQSGGGPGSGSGSDGGLAACGPSVAAGTSDDCEPMVGACADVTCSLPSYGYFCTPTSVPPLSGCVAYPTSASGVTGAYCCPEPTCLRNSSYDVACTGAGQGEAYSCSIETPALTYTMNGLPSGCVIAAGLEGEGGGDWCCP